MDDNGFGAYGFYFRFQRFVAAFPYRVENTGPNLSVYRQGFFKWLYYINFIAVVYGAAFQFVQLMLTIQYEPDPIHVIAQLCWMFAMCIPLSNMMAYITKEERVAQSVDRWCTLERTVIGSSLRGLPNMPNGPLPTMSACHTAQSRLFRKTAAVYLLMSVSAVIGMALHYYNVPRFPAYIYTVTSSDDPMLFYLGGVYQVWLVMIICTHVFGTEVIMVVASGSIVHCLETLSYRGAVVMANNQCDVPHFNEVLIKNWAAFEGKGPGGNNTKTVFSNTAGEKSQEKVTSALGPRSNENGKGYDEESVHLASVVQNVVDIQYALDRYKDVEAVVDSLNNSFAKMLFNHQSVYMMLMCTLFYTPIRHLQILPVEGSVLFASIALYYCIRLFIFFPSMGRVNAMSYTFVESWMEGLRHIPRGKYAYEFYMHKLESCRKLAFDAGGFYLMQKGTVLTFVSIVTTHIIVLLQLY